jgi:hypothetical protein
MVEVLETLSLRERNEQTQKKVDILNYILNKTHLNKTSLNVPQLLLTTVTKLSISHTYQQNVV